MSLNCTRKNGEHSKFYALCISPQFFKSKRKTREEKEKGVGVKEKKI